MAIFIYCNIPGSAGKFKAFSAVESLACSVENSGFSHYRFPGVAMDDNSPIPRLVADIMPVVE